MDNSIRWPEVRRMHRMTHSRAPFDSVAARYRASGERIPYDLVEALVRKFSTARDVCGYVAQVAGEHLDAANGDAAAAVATLRDRVEESSGLQMKKDELARLGLKNGHFCNIDPCAVCGRGDPGERKRGPRARGYEDPYGRFGERRGRW